MTIFLPLSLVISLSIHKYLKVVSHVIVVTVIEVVMVVVTRSYSLLRSVGFLGGFPNQSWTDGDSRLWVDARDRSRTSILALPFFVLWSFFQPLFTSIFSFFSLIFSIFFSAFWNFFFRVFSLSFQFLLILFQFFKMFFRFKKNFLITFS